jgi:hypothetical protein
VIARLHANVALLEKVRFSLLHLRSADTERVGGEASPLLDALEELSREIDATSTAVGEVFGRNAVDPHVIASGPAAPALPSAAGPGSTPNGRLHDEPIDPDTLPPGVIDRRS